MTPLIPGELMPEPGELELNAGRPVTSINVANSGDRRVVGFNGRINGPLDA